MQSKPLTFGELNIGDRFIGFPTDGDDNGHGGFRGGSYVFRKTTPKKEGYIEDYYVNAVRLFDKSKSNIPDSMLVLKVII